jgi:lipopolysaccharide export LptBFGC system permease protein LptF
VIADLQIEYAAAIRAGDVWKSRWTLVVGYVAFAKVTLWCGLLGLRRAGRRWSREDSQGLRSVVWLSGSAIVCVSALLWLLELPRTRDMLEDVGADSGASVFELMIYLVPAILPLGLPVGLAIGTALGVHGRELSSRLIAFIMLVALGASTASLVTLTWVTPASNQSYREAFIGKTVARGDRELTLVELRLSLPAADRERTNRLVFEFHKRLSFALTPMTFAAFALVVAVRRRMGRIGAVGTIGFAAFGYYTALWLANSLNKGAVLPPQVGPWIPQMALVLTTALAGFPQHKTQITRTSE